MSHRQRATVVPGFPGEMASATNSGVTSRSNSRLFDVEIGVFGRTESELARFMLSLVGDS